MVVNFTLSWYTGPIEFFLNGPKGTVSEQGYGYAQSSDKWVVINMVLHEGTTPAPGNYTLVVREGFKPSGEVFCEPSTPKGLWASCFIDDLRRLQPTVSTTVIGLRITGLNSGYLPQPYCACHPAIPIGFTYGMRGYWTHTLSDPIHACRLAREKCSRKIQRFALIPPVNDVGFPAH